MSEPRYAAHTTVHPAKSEMELKALLRKHSADRIVIGEERERIILMFEKRSRRVRFVMRLPAARLYRSDAAYQQEIRRLWRSLVLIVKAKLEAEATGLVSFEDEWLSHFVLPSGDTVGERIIPSLADAASTDQLPSLLPGAQPLALPAPRQES